MYLRYLFLLLMAPQQGIVLLAQETEWQRITQDVINKIESLDESFLSQIRSHFLNSPYCSTPATVRQGTDLPPQELSFLAQRMPYVKTGLEKLLGMTLTDNQTLRIGIAGSGGGFRAMLNTLGSLLGAQESGLLDCITYASGVSGSTWAIAPFIQSGMTLQQLTQRLVQQLQRSFLDIPLTPSQWTDTLLQKKAFGEHISFVDIFGLLLARHLLAGAADPDFIYLHDQAQLIADGTQFCPIYSPIINGNSYRWVECTPFEVGSEELATFIPSWALGRQFIGGTSVNFSSPPALSFAPPLSLGFLLATWGSAFAAVIAHNLAQLKPNIPLIKEFVKLEPTTLLDAVIPAEFYNWNYQLNDLELNSTESLILMDGGIFINFDLNSLLRRKCDIIIILDASSNLAESVDLIHAYSYWGARYKLPVFNFDGVAQRTVSVFKDDNDPSVPTIIYMPQIKNPQYPFNPADCLNNFCSTFSLTYTAQQSQDLIESARLNIHDAQPLIVEAIKAKINDKNR